MRSGLALLLLLLLAAGALAIRLPQMAQRPFHTDESVHSIKFRGLLEDGQYAYDPDEYHGPSLYYITLPFALLAQQHTFAQVNETTLRMVPVVFGVGLILLLWLVRDLQGKSGIIWAGLLTALSPAMVFYSRYYIHELLLVFFTFLLLASGWRYKLRPGYGWAILAGISLGLMHATKETFVFNMAAIVAAWLGVWAWSKRVEGMRLVLPPEARGSHLAAFLLAAVVISIVFFTSFFTHAAGPLDSIRTYLPWITRAGGQTAHVHPWYYYLKILAFTQFGRGPVWSEGLILGLAAVGFGAAFIRKELKGIHVPWVRFIGIYTLILTLAYSLIPYKTPWCLLGFLHGLILLAGIGAVVLIRLLPYVSWKIGTTLLLAALTVQLGWQAYRTSYRYEVDRRNPYVYAHTAANLLELVEQLEALAKVSPDGFNTPIQVAAKGMDYWPLPWYLRHFQYVGFWGEVPQNPEKAPLLVASPDLAAAMEEPLDKTHLMVTFYMLREPHKFLQLFVQADLWKAYLEAEGRLEKDPEDE